MIYLKIIIKKNKIQKR